MELHESRLLEEANNLQDKIEKLDAFINSRTFDTLPDVEQGLLATQQAAMTTYYGVLLLRIERINNSK